MQRLLLVDPYRDETFRLSAFNRLAIISVLLTLPGLLLWSANLFAQMSGVSLLGQRLESIASSALGAAIVLLALDIFPFAAIVTGTIARRQVNRRGGRGDTLGFIGIALSCLLMFVGLATLFAHAV